MHRQGRRAGRWALPFLVLALGAAACRPVLVQPDQATLADIAVPAQQEEELNILGIGVADAERRIILRTTGAAVSRGSTVEIGVMGPGMVEGTAFFVVGIDLSLKLVRFAMTEGGSGESQPAAVLSLTVPDTVSPGLYSILAFRNGRYAIYSGGLEVV